MILSYPFAEAFGLDIGDESIKLARLKRNWSWRQPAALSLVEIREITLPPGAIVNGEIVQPELVRKKLLHLLGKDGRAHQPLTTPWVVADLPEPKTFLKLIDIPAPAAELIDEDVLYQARKHLPFELEEAFVDWQIIPSETETATATQVLVGAVPKIVADSYTYLLESADLKPIALEIEAVPLCRTLITEAKIYTGEARGILDVGATRASFIVYDHGTIQFSTSLPFSGNLVTTALAQGLKLDYAVAEKLKISQGLGLAPAYPTYASLLAPLVDGLVMDLRRTLLFYKEHFPLANPVTHITLCGGMSRWRNFDSWLSQKLKISTHPGNVWKNFRPTPVAAEWRDRGLTFASALGLALRAAKGDRTSAL